MTDKENKSKEMEKKLKLAYEATLKLPRTYMNTRNNSQVITGIIGTPSQMSFFYEGEVRGNIPDGLGKLTYQVANGTLLKDHKCIYEGEFIAGEPNGKGKYIIREKDGDVIYETSQLKKKDGTIIEGRFKGLVLKAEGYFKYQIKKNNKTFDNGNVFLFKDHSGESPFIELGVETFIKGEAFATEKTSHTLTYNENSIYYYLTSGTETGTPIKYIYKGQMVLIKYEVAKKKKLCRANTFPLPHGKGTLTLINLNKKSEWYNKKQTRVGTFDHFDESGIIKSYLDDDLLSEGNYTNGKKDGLIKFFDVDGSVIKEVLYKDGIEQKK
jgi:antitoxin component YwqK of YwqJK toxin-antitoxin module